MNSELTAQEMILVSLTAATDAVWLPSRESHYGQINVAVTNAYELRKAYRESGVAWASGESTDAGRKEKQRALEELARSGLITIAKPNLSKTLFAKLTDSTYSRLRRQCDEPGFAVGFQMLRLAADYSVRPPTLMQHIWIPETQFNNDRGWGDGNQNELFRVSQNALPALVAGWLNTNCDSQRHVYYSVTAAGWRLLDEGCRPSSDDEVQRDTRFALAYYQQLGIERARLFTRTPNDDGELGWLALPVCHHDTPISR